MILIFKLSDPSVKQLMESDPVLAKLIKRIGNYTLELNDDYYLKLVQSIVGQQLSIKAKETIWNRVENLCKDITATEILNVSDNDLRNAGISHSKISYIKGLSEKILANDLTFKNIESLNNNGVIELLTTVKGIGKWTAEMFLIFSLGRLDVMANDDAGLKRAIKWLYNFESTPIASEMNKISECWKPYRSIASLYLWKAIDTGLIHKNPNLI